MPRHTLSRPASPALPRSYVVEQQEKQAARRREQAEQRRRQARAVPCCAVLCYAPVSPRG